MIKNFEIKSQEHKNMTITFSKFCENEEWNNKVKNLKDIKIL